MSLRTLGGTSFSSFRSRSSSTKSSERRLERTGLYLKMLLSFAFLLQMISIEREGVGTHNPNDHAV